MLVEQKRILQLVLLIGTLSQVATANIILGPDVNTLDPVFTVTGFTADGVAMANSGLLIRITFSDTTTSGLVAWTHPNSGACLDVNGCGQATGSVPGGGTWTLLEQGDTGGLLLGNPFNPWTLTNTSSATSITKVELIGGNLVAFDRQRQAFNTADGTFTDVGTPGSAGGITFVYAGVDPNTYTATVTYSNLISLIGPSQSCGSGGSVFTGQNTVAGCGDEYNNISFLLGNGGNGFRNNGSNASFVFFQDTDLIGSPEPGTFALMGIALAGLIGYQVRRRRTN